MNRELTPMELLLFHMNEHSCTSVGMVLTVAGPVTGDLLQLALHKISNHYPILRSQVIERKTTHDMDFTDRQWVPIPGDIPEWFSFETVESKENIFEHAKKILEKSLLEPFGMDKKLMRVFLIHSSPTTSCIVLVCTHALMDGRGMIMFVDKLISFLDLCKRGLQDTVETPKIVDVNVELTRSNLGNSVYSNYYVTLPIQEKVHCNQREWAIQLHKLPTTSNFLPNLLSSCKRNSTTVTAALSSAFAFVVHREQKKEDICDTFHISTPVDARPFANTRIQDADIQNNFVLTTVELDIDDKDNFWTVAKKYQTTLTKNLTKRQWMDTDVPGWMFVREDMIEEDQDLFESQARNNSFTISNVGDINRQLAMSEAWKHGEFCVTDMCATVSQQLLGAPMFIVVLTLNGCIYLSVGFPTPTYSRDYIRSLCEKVEQEIITAITEK